MVIKSFRALLGLVATVALASAANANVLNDFSFESVDTSGGDVGGAGASWGAYGTVFTTSQALPQTGTPAFDGNNVIKMFGPFGGEDGNTVGVFQTFSINGGDSYSASAQFLDWSSDSLDGSAVMTIAFDTGDTVTNTLLKADFINQNEWYTLALAGIAPAGATSATITLAHLNNGATGGSLFLDAASVEVNPIPLPAAVWLMGSGLLGLAGLRRRKA
ncbi:MAG: VPLPA-CTERM sorting domain-containing protein [Gammaproteobacteria bacterium]|nr:VPLPA-CTERM sorting domain-containing protein [Gammaproteobacteria bacterium]